MLKVPQDSTKEQIEIAYKNQSKFYDPSITGTDAHAQFYEELTLAYKTLIDENTREEYDDYLSSVGNSRSH